MEILLLAAIAWAMGQQSEQSKLGLTPAHRAHLKEQHRHEKTLRKITAKHGPPPDMAGASGISPWKEPPGPTGPDMVPDTFLSGYRSRRPVRPPFSSRAGTWVGQGVTWAQDTGRNAWQSYRDRRRKNGDEDPALVLVPVAPAMPNAPPMPTSPPTVGVAAGQTKTAPPTADHVTQPAAPGDSIKPDSAAEAKPAETTPEATAPAPAGTDTEAQPQTGAEQTDTTQPIDTPAATPGGVGRMAAEVTYESVMDESDELSLMCDDDIRVYGRIRERAEREISRGDELIAKLQEAGFGPKVIGWVARCKEQYQVILGQLDDLEKNTTAQGEQVVKAKALLESGQGVYAGIAQDMESVADRQSYISDAVDAEDTQAHAETYETKAAA